jgi:lysozyme family protein
VADAFLQCLQFTLPEEGGFVDDPADPGGATNKGVTLAAFRDWRAKATLPEPTVDDLKAISDDELQAFYATGYWNTIRGHDLPPGIDLLTFDFGVNAGWHRSATFLQQAIGLTGRDVDGWVGPQTLAQLAKTPLRSVFVEQATRQVQHYVSLGTFGRFGDGWLHRTFRRLTTSLDMGAKTT